MTTTPLRPFFAALRCALALLSAGCATPPAGGVALTSGPFITNACLVDAIHCYASLRDTGAEPAILAIEYTAAGQTYGHAMTRYFWAPRPAPGARCYLFDRTNASTDIPLAGDDPLALAQYIMPQRVTRAWWLDPAELTQGHRLVPVAALPHTAP